MVFRCDTAGFVGQFRDCGIHIRKALFQLCKIRLVFLCRLVMGNRGIHGFAACACKQQYCQHHKKHIVFHFISLNQKLPGCSASLSSFLFCAAFMRAGFQQCALRTQEPKRSPPNQSP